MIKKIKTGYSKRVLKQAINNLEKSGLPNFKLVKKIVVILDPKSLIKLEILAIQKLLLAENNTMNIRFISYAKNSQESTVLNIERLSILDQTDLNWYYQPKELAISNCDLLIDLTFDEILALQYLSVYSSAKAKIGVDKGWKKDLLSLMIQSNKSDEIASITEQLIKYTNLINNKNA